MPPFAFALVTIPNARAKVARERPARRAALVIPGIASGGRGAIRPRSQRPRQPRYAGAQIRRDQPDPCAVPVSFQCRAELGRTGEDAKEPLVRGRRFAALDANAHLIPRRGVSPSCQKVRTVIKSLSVCPRGHHCCLGWADLAEGRLCLDHLPAMAVRRLSSPALARIPRETRKSPARHPPLTLRPQAVRVDRPSAC